jgi:hypothetical protein
MQAKSISFLNIFDFLVSLRAFSFNLLSQLSYFCSHWKHLYNFSFPDKEQFSLLARIFLSSSWIIA